MGNGGRCGSFVNNNNKLFDTTTSSETVFTLRLVLCPSYLLILSSLSPGNSETVVAGAGGAGAAGAGFRVHRHHHRNSSSAAESF